MPMVKLKLCGWLPEYVHAPWANGDSLVTTREGDTILEMCRRLALEDEGFRQIVFGQDDLGFGGNVLVVLNGVSVNPHDPAGTVLKNTDEVILLPALEGG